MKNIGSVVIRNWKEFVDKLFMRDDIEESFLIPSYFERSVSSEHSFAPRFSFNIGEIIDTLKSELDTYIHQSFENHFNLRMQKNEFVSAYKLAVVYHDANEENTTKANKWIVEIQEKATFEVEKIAETYMGLACTNLRAKQLTKANSIIELFQPETDPIRVHLKQRFKAVLDRPVPAIPTAEQLTIYREITDKLFKNEEA